MIALYHNNYFNFSWVDSEDIGKLFCYKKVLDFDNKTTKLGNTVYFKLVSIDELDDLFDIGFQVLYNGNLYEVGSFSFESRELTILTSEELIAKEKDFVPVYYERGEPIEWCKNIKIDEVQEFYLRKRRDSSYANRMHKDLIEKSIVSREDFILIFEEAVMKLDPRSYKKMAKIKSI